MDKFCEENGFLGWYFYFLSSFFKFKFVINFHMICRYETSAKSNVGIDEAAKCLVGKVLQDSNSQPKKEKSDGFKIKVDGNKPPPPQEEGGCC